MKELGVTDHRFLGGFGTYRDSGMKWHEDGHAVAADDVHDNAFWHADLTEAADHLVEVIREVRPQVLVTYDQFGGYGHPDHIQAHRVAMYAAQLAAVPSYRRDLGEPWDIAKIYWGAMSESRMREGLRALREAGDTTTFEGMDPDGPLPPFVTADENLAAAVDAHGLRRPQDGRAAPRTPPRSPPTARSSRCPTTSAARRLGHRVLPDRQGHAGRARRRRARDRPVRRASDDRARVVGARPAAGWARVTGLASVAVHAALVGPAAGASAATVGDRRRAARRAGGRGCRSRSAGPALVGSVVSPRAEGDYAIAADRAGLRAARASRCWRCVVAVATLPATGRPGSARAGLTPPVRCPRMTA